MRLIGLFAIVVSVWGCDNGTTAAPSSVLQDLSAVAPPADFAGVTIFDLASPTVFPGTAAVTVGIGNTLTFAPATVDIAKGGTVTWTWAAANTMLHNVTSGDATPAFAASPTQQSGTFQVTFPIAGSFFYFCTVHGRNVMNGTVNVH
jgi:plastocyanin